MKVYCCISVRLSGTRGHGGSVHDRHDSLLGTFAQSVQKVGLLPEGPRIARTEARSDDLAAVHELVPEADRLAGGIGDLLRRPPHPPTRGWDCLGWVARCLKSDFWRSKAG